MRVKVNTRNFKPDDWSFEHRVGAWLRWRAKRVLLIALCVGIGGAMGLALTPSVYRSKVVISLEPDICGIRDCTGRPMSLSVCFFPKSTLSERLRDWLHSLVSTNRR